MIKFGKARQFADVTIQDHLKFPVWTSAHDGRHDEQSEKPIVSASEVTQEIIDHPLIVPVITVKVEGTEIYGTAWYLHGERKIFAISIWYDGRWRALSHVPELAAPVVLISVPAILGVTGVSFLCPNLRYEQAQRIG